MSIPISQSTTYYNNKFPLITKIDISHYPYLLAYGDNLNLTTYASIIDSNRNKYELGKDTYKEASGEYTIIYTNPTNDLYQQIDNLIWPSDNRPKILVKISKKLSDNNREKILTLFLNNNKLLELYDYNPNAKFQVPKIDKF